MSNQYSHLKSFSAEFAQYFDNAPMQELLDAYCENHKDAFGIKGRWIYSQGLSRAQLAQEFDILAISIKIAEETEQQYQQAFLNNLNNVGLKDWAERNNIHNEYDLYDHQYMMEYQTQDDAPSYYETLAISKGFIT